MNPFQRLVRTLGPAGATANARRSCEELRGRAQYAEAIDRRFAPRPAATRKSSRRVA